MRYRLAPGAAVFGVPAALSNKVVSVVASTISSVTFKPII